MKEALTLVELHGVRSWGGRDLVHRVESPALAREPTTEAPANNMRAPHSSTSVDEAGS
jgi:hypothetical protein